MSAADFQILPLHAIGRTIIGLLHDHGNHRKSLHDQATAHKIDAFQNKVARLFLALPSSSDEFLSLPWLRSLLEVFAVCQEEFRILLLNNKSCLANPSLEMIIGDFYEGSVKALDVCNAIRDGIEQIRQWKKLLEIVFDAIDNGNSRRKSNQKGLSEGLVRRAKKALADLAIAMLEDKGSNSFFHRSRSFGMNQSSKDPRSLRKSLSWSHGASLGAGLHPGKSKPSAATSPLRKTMTTAQHTASQQKSTP